MSESERLDKQMLDTILSILTRCNYPNDYQIYCIASELAQEGYVKLTEKTWAILDKHMPAKSA